MKTSATTGAMTVRRADPKPRVILPFRLLPWEAREGLTTCTHVRVQQRTCNNTLTTREKCTIAIWSIILIRRFTAKLLMRNYYMPCVFELSMRVRRSGWWRSSPFIIPSLLPIACTFQKRVDKMFITFVVLVYSFIYSHISPLCRKL